MIIGEIQYGDTVIFRSSVSCCLPPGLAVQVALSLCVVTLTLQWLQYLNLTRTIGCCQLKIIHYICKFFLSCCKCPIKAQKDSRNSEITTPSLQECLSKMFPWVGVVISYLCKLFEESNCVWKGKVTSCYGNTKEKRQACFQHDSSVCYNFMKSNCWIVYYKLAVTAWKSRPKSFCKYVNMLERQQSNGNLITSCNWGIVNFLIQAVLCLINIYFEKQIQQSITHNPQAAHEMTFPSWACLSFFTRSFVNDWVLCLLFTIKCS